MPTLTKQPESGKAGWALARLKSLLFAAALAGGCYGTTEAYVTDDVPPPPQEEVVVAQPGMFWVGGHWWRDHDRWSWRRGYYERERPGQVFVQGRWARDGGRWRYHEGGFRARVTRR